VTNTETPDELLTPGQAAALIGITPDTLGDWARKGVLPFQRVRPGGHRRFRRSDVDALIKAAAEDSTTTPSRASA
jgi:excisionase family DNA binding protein